MDYDVVVVGAGPTGSATARDIAAAGFRVLVVESKSQVGEPVMCSGLVSPRTLEMAGVSPGLVLNRITGGDVHCASGKSLSLGEESASGGYALAIDRSAFDRELVEQAQTASAELHSGARLVDIARQDGHLELSIRRPGRLERVTTHLLVGADGVRSRVARWLGVNRSAGLVRCIAGEGRLRDAPPERAQIFLGDGFAPGWFGWVIPLGDGRVRIGTGDSSGGHRSLASLLDRMRTAFPDQLATLELASTWAKPIPIYAPIKTYADNVLLVGDAARQVKPISGGGIFTGLVGAKHCAQSAVRALAAGDFSADFLATYESSWMEELGTELGQGLQVRRAYALLEPGEIDTFLDLIDSNGWLKKLVATHADIDFPVTAVRRLGASLPMGLILRYLPLRPPLRSLAASLFLGI